MSQQKLGLFLWIELFHKKVDLKKVTNQKNSNTRSDSFLSGTLGKIKAIQLKKK